MAALDSSVERDPRSSATPTLLTTPPRFGTRLESMTPRPDRKIDGVDIFANAESTSLARSINARAFTIGGQVHFDQAEYRLNTATGKDILAHEMQHVAASRRNPTLEGIVMRSPAQAHDDAKPTGQKSPSRYVRLLTSETKRSRPSVKWETNDYNTALVLARDEFFVHQLASESMGKPGRGIEHMVYIAKAVPVDQPNSPVYFITTASPGEEQAIVENVERSVFEIKEALEDQFVVEHVFAIHSHPRGPKAATSDLATESFSGVTPNLDAQQNVLGFTGDVATGLRLAPKNISMGLLTGNGAILIGRLASGVSPNDVGLEKIEMSTDGILESNDISPDAALAAGRMDSDKLVIHEDLARLARSKDFMLDLPANFVQQMIHLRIDEQVRVGELSPTEADRAKQKADRLLKRRLQENWLTRKKQGFRDGDRDFIKHVIPGMLH